jgi:hypothetical protein
VLSFLTAGIAVAARGLYGGSRNEEPLLFTLLANVAWYWVIGWWLIDDLRRRRETWIYCPGILITAWALWLPYYLLKTRGVRALITIACFVAFVIAALIIGLIIGLLLVSY